MNTPRSAPWQFHPASQLNAHAAQWNELQQRTERHAFLRASFLVALLDEFGTGAELLAVKAGASGWSAAALLQPAGRGRWASFQPSQLPLGPVLLAAGESLDEAARQLLRALPGPALVLGLTQLDSLHHRGDAAALDLRSQHYIDTAWVDVVTDFDTYWEARGKNLRQNTRKQLKKVEASGAVPRLELIEAHEQIAEAVEQYGMLESSGWKAEQGTAISADGGQGRFYRHALESAAREGHARLYRYWFGDEVVAMDLCVHQDDCIVILKTAYQAAHHAVSPSTLMRAEEFEKLFKEGRFKRIEFFGRVMEWHTRWTESSRPLFHLTVYRWGWLKSLQEWLHRRRGAANE
ncbi:MAG: GNAT family N-acetyltransferase [Rubrivivax sp.]|nr:MAG: GNAT family N-acetyltransferase [Rubrivivax sp.]